MKIKVFYLNNKSVTFTDVVNWQPSVKHGVLALTPGIAGSKKADEIYIPLSNIKFFRVIH